MFTVKPLARNRPTPVPYPFEEMTLTNRFVTTNDANYVITDPKLHIIRLNRAGEKTITLPAGTDGRLVIIQDIGGSTAGDPCTIKCADYAFNGGDTTKEFVGTFTIALKFNGASYDIVAQRNKWSIEYTLLGDQPTLSPVRTEDTLVESIDGNMLILLGNSLNREVVVSKPAIEPTDTVYPEQYFTVFDTVGTANTYPITIRFEDTKMNGNTQFIMAGNSSWVTFRSLPDGSYQYILSSGATFSGFDVAFSGKAFGFISEDAAYYNTVTRGFSSTGGATGGTFLTTNGA